MIGKSRRVSLVFLLGILAAGPAAWSQAPMPEAALQDPELLVEALRHPDSRIRQNAASQLIKLGEKAVPALLPMMKTGSEFETASAAIVLSNLKNAADPVPASLRKALYDILSDPKTDVRRWNITANLVIQIAEDSLKDHIALWTWGANHPSPLIGNASLSALQKIGSDGRAAESAVLALLNRPRLPLTSVVLKPRVITDGLIGFEQAVPDYDPLVILETLIAIGADAKLLVEPLTVLTNHPSEYVRADAAELLAKLDPAQLKTDPRPLAARVLAGLAVLPWGQVRELAVVRLGDIGASAAGEVPALAKLLEDKNGNVRMQAAIALGKMGAAAQSAVPALEKALRFSPLESEENREAMQKALDQIQHPEAVPPAPSKARMI